MLLMLVKIITNARRLVNSKVVLLNCIIIVVILFVLYVVSDYRVTDIGIVCVLYRMYSNSKFIVRLLSSYCVVIVRCVRDFA